MAIFWVAGTKPQANDVSPVERRSQAQVDGRKAHWERIYNSKAHSEVSWFQNHAETSLDFISSTGVGADGQIIDVGGGASTLVDDLLDLGYRHVAVLDISRAALADARRRLGKQADSVEWIEADITQVELEQDRYDIWHDRAVFHFLTQIEDRQRYIDAATAALKPGGHLIIATFASDGPDQCSDLDVMRYSPDDLQAEFGGAFQMVKSVGEVHLTPFGAQQRFVYCYFRKR